jgi:hypothetical protein
MWMVFLCPLTKIQSNNNTKAIKSSVDLVHPDLSREGPRFEPVCSHRIKKGHSHHVDGFFMSTYEDSE